MRGTGGRAAHSPRRANTRALKTGPWTPRRRAPCPPSPLRQPAPHGSERLARARACKTASADPLSPASSASSLASSRWNAQPGRAAFELAGPPRQPSWLTASPQARGAAGRLEPAVLGLATLRGRSVLLPLADLSALLTVQSRCSYQRAHKRRRSISASERSSPVFEPWARRPTATGPRAISKRRRSSASGSW